MSERRERESLEAIPEVEPAELSRWFDSGISFVLLDVREPDEREYCRIEPPNAVSDLFIPMREIPESLEVLRQALAEVGEARLLVYCHHGVRSKHVARWLCGQGISGVHNLRGGIDRWSCEVDPSVMRY